jgi:hypothetical protein
MKQAVAKAEYKIMNDGNGFLTALDLGADIAIVCHNPNTQCTGLCRSQTNAEIRKFLQEMAAGCDISRNLAPILQLRLVGGLMDDVPSMDNLKNTMAAVQEFEDGRDIIDILSADILEKPHPDSFAVMVRDGSLSEIDP